MREVAATSAHLALLGETRGKYQEVAGKFNANASIHEKVSCKGVRYRCRRIQDQLYKRTSCDGRISGIGGDDEGLEEVLIDTQ